MCVVVEADAVWQAVAQQFDSKPGIKWLRCTEK
jgi:hypothetical protein